MAQIGGLYQFLHLFCGIFMHRFTKNSFGFEIIDQIMSQNQKRKQSEIASRKDDENHNRNTSRVAPQAIDSIKRNLEVPSFKERAPLIINNSIYEESKSMKTIKSTSLINPNWNPSSKIIEEEDEKINENQYEGGSSKNATNFFHFSESVQPPRPPHIIKQVKSYTFTDVFYASFCSGCSNNSKNDKRSKNLQRMKEQTVVINSGTFLAFLLLYLIAFKTIERDICKIITSLNVLKSKIASIEGQMSQPSFMKIQKSFEFSTNEQNQTQVGYQQLKVPRGIAQPEQNLMQRNLPEHQEFSQGM